MVDCRMLSATLAVVGQSGVRTLLSKGNMMHCMDSITAPTASRQEWQPDLHVSIEMNMFNI